MCGDILSSDPIKRLAYNIAVAIFAYIAPLIAIFYSYFRILYVLQKRCDRRTFRFVQCRGSSRGYDGSEGSCSLRQGSTKASNPERNPALPARVSGQSLVQQEINAHNMKTITRAKLKTLKLTVILGIKFL